MKKYISILLASILCFGSCDKMVRQELTQLHDEIDGLKERLENFCNEMNTNIAALQTIVDGLVNNDYVESVEPIKGANDLPIGYIIKFHKSGPVTIYHGRNGKDGYDGEDGEDGSDGADGEDGSDGADGTVPVIGVRQDADGNWYWTLDGEWLLDDKGNKVRASGKDGKDGEDGEDGKDGEDGMDGSVGGDGIDGEDGKDGKPGKDGKDGVTPQLRIDGGYWYISYDKGVTWTRLGKATGEDGAPGKDADVPDAIFTDITFDENAIYFTLKDGSVITVNKNRPLKIHFEEMKNIVVAPGTTVSINYTIEGGDSNTQVECIADNGWKAKVVAKDTQSGAISVTAPEVEVDGKVLVFVTAGDGRVHMSCLTFVEGRPMVGQPVFTIGYEGGDLSVNVTTRIEYTVKIVGKPAWVALAPATKAVERTDTLRFTVEANPYSVDREAEVQLHDLDGNLAESFIIRQKKNTTDNGGIVFVDPEVERICLENWDTDGNGSLSYAEAAAVTTLSTYFRNNDKIVSFDELQYFTGLRTIYGSGSSSNPYGAFYSCSKLRSITLPDGVISLQYSAFMDCTSLRKVVLPESLTTIGQSAFYGCSNLFDAKIPDGVSEIYSSAFSGCYKLPVDALPKAIKMLGDRAFYDCDAIRTISLPFIAQMGEYVFSGCDGLISATVEEGWDVLPSRTFEGCDRLLEVSLPEGLTQIGKYAFASCPVLTECSMPSSLIVIDDYAFQNCIRLAEVELNDGLFEIGVSVFEGCEQLDDVVIPKTVQYIYSTAFKNCKSLKSIELPELINSVSSGCFIGCISLNTVVLSDYVTSIGSSAFSGCVNLSPVQLPLTVTSIGESAFSNCDSFESFVVPTFVQTLPDYCFQSCNSLKEIILPQSLKTIKTYCFSYCTSLQSIDIPLSVNSIGSYAFRNCDALKEITIPVNVTSLPSYLFDDCSLLETVNMHDNITSIGDNAFRNCDALKEVILPAKLTGVSQGLFQYSDQLESVTIPSAVRTVYHHSATTGIFYSCTALKEIIMLPITPPYNSAGSSYTASGFLDGTSGVQIKVPAESLETYRSWYFWKPLASVIIALETE